MKNLIKSIVIFMIAVALSIPAYADGNPEVSGVRLVDEFNIPALTVSEGGALKSIGISEEAEGMAIAALYEDKVLISAAATTLKGISAGKLPIDFPRDMSNKSLKIFLWDDNNSPYGELAEYVNGAAVLETALTIQKNGTSVASDVNSYYTGQTLMVPAKSVLNIMGVEFTKCEDGYKAVRNTDGRSLVLNGTNCDSWELFGDAHPMVSAELLNTAFGIEISPDAEDDSILNITGTEAVEPEGVIEDIDTFATIERGTFDITYRISGGVHSVNVYYKKATDQRDVANGIFSEEELYYHSTPAPVMTADGVWEGGFSVLRNARVYDILIRAEDINGNVDWYKATAETNRGRNTLYASSNTTYNDTDIPYDWYSEYVAVDDLLLVPTYENLSYYYKSDAEDCKVYYKKTTDTAWSEAFMPYEDNLAKEKQFRGSIVGLEEGTSYDIKLCELSAAGTLTEIEKVGTFTTMNSSPQIAENIPLSQIYSGSGSLSIANRKGTENGYIRIYDDGTHPVTSYDTLKDALLVSNCDYLILDGLKIVGGRNGIKLSHSCNNVIIRNCDISGWGRQGIYDKDTNRYVLDGIAPNNDAGISLLGSGRITVEKCFIHSPAGRTNYWNTLAEGTHPNGPCGIFYGECDSLIIRYNNIVGDEEHMLNDAIESAGNGSYGGGANRDSDIYGNYFANGCDDGIELDGSQMNVRAYGNRIENFLCGISTAANVVGPSYIYANQVTELRDDSHTETRRTGSAIKGGGYGKNDEKAVPGVSYVFNNTFVNDKSRGISSVGYSGNSDLRIYSRNNIYVNENESYAVLDSSSDTFDSYDYDLFKGTIGVSSTGALGSNNLTTGPSFEDNAAGIYKLTNQSVGKGYGTEIKNFAASGCDLGAYGLTGTAFMPMRETSLAADKYKVKLTPENITAEITVNTEDFDVVLNNCEWLTVTKTDSRVTISASSENCKRSAGYAVVLITDNSNNTLPIWVKFEK